MYEYELEALAELEGEYENEFEEEGELEGEFEYELESEFEAEGEEETFFGTLARLARRALSSPALRRVAQSAAQSALNAAQPQSEYEYEFEEEAEWESEAETESVLNPIRRIYPDALMEHFGHAAAAAESEEEAEAFVSALVPLARGVASRVLPRLARTAVRAVARPAARALARPSTMPAIRPRPGVARLTPPRVAGRAGLAPVRAARTIRRATPQLVRGVRRMTRTLRSRPATRPLVRVMPTVVQRTVNTLGQRAAAGVPVTPNQVVQTLAQQAARVLGSPQQAVQAYQRSIAMDRRYHAAQPGSNLCPSCRQRVCSQCGSSY